VAQVENDKYCRRVLKHHWPEVPYYADIREFSGSEWRGIDIISGGFPCQDLSISGRREGLAGARSGLFFEMCRVVDEVQPRIVIWENVPGLLNADEGGAMATVLGALADIGYSGCWTVLDSQFFGVPQRRRRVFGAFAHRSVGGWACGAAVLLEPEGGGWDPSKGRETGTKVAECANTCSGGSGRNRRQVAFVPRIAYTCTARDGKGVNLRECTNTLVAVDGVRRLTPLEHERLQSFPDGWTDVGGMSDIQRYRQIGNAVTVNVAYWIGLRIVATLSTEADNTIERLDIEEEASGK